MGQGWACFSNLSLCLWPLSSLFSPRPAHAAHAHARLKQADAALIWPGCLTFRTFFARSNADCARLAPLRFWPRRAILSSRAAPPAPQSSRDCFQGADGCGPAHTHTPRSRCFMRSPGFFAPRRAAARRAPPGPLGMKKERRSPRRPFPVKICENSRPPSRRPCPLSLDIPGFSHVLPSCPALSRLSQLSCLFTFTVKPMAKSLRFPCFSARK